jgi:H+/gluconate symporter-like permease
MSVLVVLLCLAALIFVAYRGYSVILFAPIVALGAVFLFQPISTFPAYTHLFMDKASFFFKMYFPTFLLGAIFGKVVELSGFAKSICAALFRLVGKKNVVLAIVLVTAILSYGGVSAFVLVFAIYPFASEMFRMGQIPKRLIPGVIWFGGITFTMDALPGSPQIQNIIPTSFFKTNAYAGPWLGVIGSIFILALGLIYFEWQRRKALAANEPYDSGWKLVNEPEPYTDTHLPNPWIATLPLVVVWVLNYVFTMRMTSIFGQEFSLSLPGMKAPIIIDVAGMTGLWAVELALVFAIITVFLFAWKQVVPRFNEGCKAAISGCLLAITNTASEFGYGSIIAVLPGFLLLSRSLKTAIPNPLLSEAISVQLLAGIVGSASGGLSIALGAMSDVYIAAANAAHIPLEVAHRVASMASGGMDSLPHNGAVITMLAITGLTHRQAYKHIFACTIIKTVAVFFVIAVYYLFRGHII